MSVPMECLFNREEWLELAISTLSEYPKQKTAWGILRWYLSTEYGELSNEELLKEASQLQAAWMLRNLVDAGSMEFNYETQRYRLTAEGREMRAALARLKG